MAAVSDYELCEEDFNACYAAGGDPMCWKGVMEEIGLRFTGHDINAAIVFGISEARSDIQDRA
jgi:hypothetical protein